MTLGRRIKNTAESVHVCALVNHKIFYEKTIKLEWYQLIDGPFFFTIVSFVIESQNYKVIVFNIFINRRDENNKNKNALNLCVCNHCRLRQKLTFDVSLW